MYRELKPLSTRSNHRLVSEFPSKLCIQTSTSASFRSQLRFTITNTAKFFLPPQYTAGPRYSTQVSPDLDSQALFLFGLHQQRGLFCLAPRKRTKPQKIFLSFKGRKHSAFQVPRFPNYPHGWVGYISQQPQMDHRADLSMFISEGLSDLRWVSTLPRVRGSF